MEKELNRIYKPAIASFKVSTTVEHITVDYTTDGEAGYSTPQFSTTKNKFQ